MSSSRMSYLLGEVRRQMNGAVAGSMRYYGAEYGLNYGVSLPTIRTLARAEEVDHKVAKLLYRQQVRELQLTALWVAESEEINKSEEEREFWIKGITNSEIAEEAAFALLHKCDWVAELLQSDDELVCYAAALAMAKRCETNCWRNEVLPYWATLIKAIEREERLLPKGVVTIFDQIIKSDIQSGEIDELLSQLPKESKGAAYILDEVAWRIEL